MCLKSAAEVVEAKYSLDLEGDEAVEAGARLLDFSDPKDPYRFIK